MKEGYKIRLRENAVPYAVSAQRRVPLPLQVKVKAELKHLEDWEVICLVCTNPCQEDCLLLKTASMNLCQQHEAQIECDQRSKTHKRLKEHFLIRRNRTKRANFQCNHLFQARYNTTENS